MRESDERTEVASSALLAEKSADEWTHKKMVRRMCAWLKMQRISTVIIAELHTNNSETPDVIAWRGGASILIECKVSRADFLADHKKWFRQREKDGMGDTRYIAAPKGLVKADEVPEGWGLYEVDKVVRLTKEARHMTADKRRECIMLVSALRRLELSTAVYVVHEDSDTANPGIDGKGCDRDESK